MLSSLLLCFASLMLCSSVESAMSGVALPMSKSESSSSSRSLLDLNTEIDNDDLFSIKKTFRSAVYKKHKSKDDLESYSYLEPISDWMQDCDSVCDNDSASSSSDDNDNSPSTRSLGTNKHSKSDDKNHCCKGGISFLKFRLQGNTQSGLLTIDSNFVDCDHESDDEEYHPNYRRMTTYDRKGNGVGGKKGSSVSGSRDSVDSNDYRWSESDDSGSSDSKSDSYDDHNSNDSKDKHKNSHSSDDSNSNDDSEDKPNDYHVRFVPCNDSERFEAKTFIEASPSDVVCIATWKDGETDYTQDLPDNVHIYFESDDDVYSLVIPTTCKTRSSYDLIGLTHVFSAGCNSHTTPHDNFNHKSDIYIDYEQGFSSDVYAAHEFLGFPSNVDITLSNCGCSCDSNPVNPTVSPIPPLAPNPQNPTSDTRPTNASPTPPTFMPLSIPTSVPLVPPTGLPTHNSLIPITIAPSVSLFDLTLNPTSEPIELVTPFPTAGRPSIDSSVPIEPSAPPSSPTSAPLVNPSGLPTHNSLIPDTVAPSLLLFDSPANPTSEPTDLVTSFPTAGRPSIDSSVPIESSAPSPSPTSVRTFQPSAPSTTESPSIDLNVPIDTSAPTTSLTDTFTLSPSSTIANPTNGANPTDSPSKLTNTATPTFIFTPVDPPRPAFAPFEFRFPTPFPTTFQETIAPSFPSQEEEPTPDPSSFNLGPSQFRFPTPSPTLVSGIPPTTFQETPLPSFSSQEEEPTPDPSSSNLGPSQFRFPTPLPTLVSGSSPTTVQETTLPSLSSQEEEPTPDPSSSNLGPSQFQFPTPLPTLVSGSSPTTVQETTLPSLSSQDEVTAFPSALNSDPADSTAPTSVDPFLTSSPSPSETGATLSPSFSMQDEITNEPTSPRQGGPAGGGTPSPSVGPVDCESVCEAWVFEYCGLLGDNGQPIPGVPCDVSESELDGEGRRRHLFEYHTILTELLALLDDPTSI